MASSTDVQIKETTIAQEKRQLLNNKLTKEDPQDAKKFVYISFYYIGLAILFPYTMLITIMDFWNYKFRDTNLSQNSTELSDLQKIFPGYLSISGNLPLTFFVILTVVLGWRVNLKKRLLLAGICELFSFAVIVVASSFDTANWQEGFLILILVANSVYGSFNAVFQASFLGNIGRFPPRYIGSAYEGTGLGQVLPAIISIVVLSIDLSQQTIGTTCLSFALLTLFLMIIIYASICKSDFYRFHSGLDERAVHGPSLSDFLSVLRSTWMYLLIVFLDYAVTLSVHPAITALVKPISTDRTPWNEKYFVPVCCFLLHLLVIGWDVPSQH